MVFAAGVISCARVALWSASGQWREFESRSHGLFDMSSYSFCEAAERRRCRCNPLSKAVGGGRYLRHSIEGPVSGACDLAPLGLSQAPGGGLVPPSRFHSYSCAGTSRLSG